MKKLQLLVYLILLSLIIMAIVNGNVHKQEALECAIYYGDTSFYDKQLYWKENGVCCRYALIDNMIKEKCKDEEGK